MQQWFEQWFDTDYYHMLYAHRNEQEARSFMDVLIQYLDLKPGQTILDNACGRGRHAHYLRQKGFKVHGLDLSPSSIAHASAFAVEGLIFKVHDMREFYDGGPFHAVFNLFTSFGYFDDRDEDLKILKSVYDELLPGGWFVLDFLNAPKVMEQVNLDSGTAVTERNGVRFETRKEIVGHKVVKHIIVADQGKILNFRESVELLDRFALQRMLQMVGFKVRLVAGDYRLQAYQQLSDRCIFICQK